MIRSSDHTFKFANAGKKILLSKFLSAYQDAVFKYVDYLWSNEIKWADKTFCLAKQQLDCPSMLNYKIIKFDTPLSARALSSAATQACGIVKAATEKQRRRLWQLNKLKQEGKDCTNLQYKIDNTELIKPVLSKKIKAELGSKCVDIEQAGGKFNYFLRLKCLGQLPHLKLPIKSTKVSNKWFERGKMMNSFLVGTSSVNIRYKIPKSKKNAGKTLGVDQGISTLMSFSDGTSTRADPHGHTYHSINQKLNRQRRGSKARARALKHRNNYFGYCLNRVKWEQIKVLKIEDVSNLGRGQSKNKFLSTWAPGVILNKVEQKAEEHEVRVELVDAAYRSQRCYKCGWVQKSNRNRKLFKCQQCHHTDDADLNAAKNIAIELPLVPTWFRQQQRNLEGFYFPVGREFIVSDDPKNDINA